MNAETTVEKIPHSLWIEIFKYISLSEAVKLKDLCPTFNKIFLIYAREYIFKIKNILHSSSENLINKLDSVIDDERIRTTKSLVLLRYVATQFNILYSTIWRYADNDETWNIISSHLVPVIDQVENIIYSAQNLLCNYESISSAIMNEYNNFFTKFDSELQDKVSKITSLTQFEIRVMDTLLSCPSIIFKMSLSRPIDGVRSYTISSLFKSSLDPELNKPPNILTHLQNLNLSNEVKKNKIITYLRECVQNENLCQLEEKIGFHDNVSSISMQTLSNEKSKVKKSPYEPIYRTVYCSRHDISSKKILHERYQRSYELNRQCPSVTLIINLPKVTPNNLPLCIQSLRGKNKSFLFDEIVLTSKTENLKFIKLDWLMKVHTSDDITVCPESHIFYMNIIYKISNIVKQNCNYKAIIDVSKAGHVNLNILKRNE